MDMYNIKVYSVLALLLIGACNSPKKEKIIDFSADGNIKGFITYEYNDQGKKIKGSKHHKDGEVTFYWLYNYAGDKMAKAVVYHGNDEISVRAKIADTPTGVSYTYEYTDTLITKTTAKTARGTIIFYAIMHYDHDGHLNKESWYSADGAQTYYTSYELDENHRIIKGMTYDYKDQLKYFEMYHFQGQNLVRINKYDKNAKPLSHQIIE